VSISANEHPGGADPRYLFCRARRQVITNVDACVVGPEPARAIVDTYLACSLDPNRLSVEHVKAIERLDEAKY